MLYRGRMGSGRLQRAGMAIGSDVDNDFIFETIHDTATLDPSITLSGGAPTAEWTVIESDGKRYEYTGTSVTHNRVTAGDMTLRLGPENIGPYVTHIDYKNDGWKGTSSIQSLALRFPNLQDFRGYTNPALAITGSLADLPSGMTYLRLSDTSSTITGSLADLPSGMTFLRLASTSSTITGALSDLPSGMTYLSLESTSSTITGGSTSIQSTGIDQILIQNTGINQSQVDDIVERIYTDRSIFTHASPSLNISGTNAAPSGTYQDGDPPTTGKEYIYELVNDPETEGFNTWSITYTA